MTMAAAMTVTVNRAAGITMAFRRHHRRAVAGWECPPAHHRQPADPPTGKPATALTTSGRSSTPQPPLPAPTASPMQRLKRGQLLGLPLSGFLRWWHRPPEEPGPLDRRK